MKSQRTSGPGARKLLVLTAVALVTAAALVAGTGATTRVVSNAANDSRGAVQASAIHAAQSSSIDWDGVFASARGELKYGRAILANGDELFVLEDNISASTAIDMSALRPARALSDSLVYNGTVAASHDLGNAYVLVTRNGEGQLTLYAGVERLDPNETSDDSYIEFEFNQGHVQAIGASRPLRGARIAGDLLVRLNLVAEIIDSVEVLRWDGEAFQVISSGLGLAGEGCAVAEGYSYCDRTKLGTLVAPESDLYDGAGIPVAVPTPGRLLEVSIDVDTLLSPDVAFASIQVRSPEDIILGSFASLYRSDDDKATTTTRELR